MPTLDVNYKRIAYTSWDPPQGATPTHTILAIHGLGSSQNYYAAMAEQLSAAGARIITIDSTGAARSRYTFVEQSVASLVRDYADVLDALHLDRVVLLGHSMCGLSVPAFAAAFPDRVQGVVLLGPVHAAVVDPAVFIGRIEAVEKGGMEAMANTTPKIAVGRKATALQRAFIRELIMGQEAAGYISMCKVIMGGGKSGVEYQKVGAPLLVVAGEEDKSAPLAGCQRIVDEAKSREKELVVLDGVGHWMAIEAVEECVAAVQKFLGKLQSA